MEWLAQNWVWLVFGIAMVFVMRRGGRGGRGGGGGCCGGGGHGPDHKHPAEEGSATNAPAGGGADPHH